MLSPQLLLAALLLFLWASPALAAPTSSIDPFRAIAAYAPRKPEQPVCCLKPLPPLEPPEEEVLLSFEEWKVKQSLNQEKAKTKEKEASNRSSHNTGGRGGSEGGNGSESTHVLPDASGTGHSLDLEEKVPPPEALSPHFRVPLTDRFNYASLDCSARVHMAHRSAKSTSSILSSKRDRYMLSPCNGPTKEQQFVVVELCEDIRIDTVQLANFEFFSGVFKDFRVSVAKTSITEDEGWTNVGVYRAKNVRGVQSFHPPTSLRDFYRYIRIDFLSHYGNEYYCPVSLLRVYGLTHLEQWKWDIWEAESRAKLDISAKDGSQAPSTPLDTGSETPAPAHLPTATNDNNSTENAAPSPHPSSSTHDAAHNPSTSNEIVPVSAPISDKAGPTVSIQSTTGTIAVARGIDTKIISKPSSIVENEVYQPSVAAQDLSIVTSDTPGPIPSVRPADASHTSPAPSQASKPPPSQPTSINASNVSTSRVVASSVHTQVSATGKSTVATTILTTSSAAVSPPTVSPPAMPITTGGESIYRTIMNRLTALEANHTLYTRYVEQQMGGVRELLRRLGEDVGRLEGIGRAQAQTHQRTVRDWEKRQQQLQIDYGELISRVEYLSDEIVLEKRLGIAQLCLLLAVLVFMGLTRGSRGESMTEHPMHLNRTMREWGRRHLSFSGDWRSRFKSRSNSDGVASGRDRNLPTPHPQSARPVPINLNRTEDDMKVEFPTRESSSREPLKTSNMNTQPTNGTDSHPHPHSQARHTSRSRTPSWRTRQYQQHHYQQRPVTPTSSTYRPRVQRSNSQGGVHHSGGLIASSGGSGPLHRSAKKWARTAHLHPVKNMDVGGSGHKGKMGTERGRENELVLDDVFSSPHPFRSRHGRQDEAVGSAELLNFGSVRKGKVRRDRGKSEDGVDGDPWVDTDFSLEDEGEWDAQLDLGRPMGFSGKEH
ncbi:hypothetical protein Hypma_016297 [Hypsizygus marmoreus]|uniref:SUN domain-containing protein n=1 Tax=Hypsizygus marmoreus TaxID=39966 RepID=A0A369J4Y6_HYPMA|nr:hypothetical protein Hypma_016297 [Hypsizygus marmoreus]